MIFSSDARRRRRRDTRAEQNSAKRRQEPRLQIHNAASSLLRASGKPESRIENGSGELPAPGLLRSPGSGDVQDPNVMPAEKVSKKKGTLGNCEDLADKMEHGLPGIPAALEGSLRATRQLRRLRKDYRGVAVLDVPRCPLGVSGRRCFAESVAERYGSILCAPSLRTPTSMRQTAPDRPRQACAINARLSSAGNADRLAGHPRSCHAHFP